MSKRVLSLILALSLLVGSLGGVTMASAEEAPVSKTTDFITSVTDIDELLRREYIDNVPLGYSENVFSLYQPGWGFDRTDIYRTGTAAGWGMPVSVKVDGAAVGVQSAEFIPSYVTSTHTPDGKPTYANQALGAQQLVDAVPTVWPSFDQTTWGCKLDYAFDGVVYGNGSKNWNTYAEPELRTGDEWVQIIFPYAVTLTAVKLHSYVDKADCGPLANAVVQVWNGSDWAAAANQVNPTFANGENHITFDDLSGKKFRILLTPTEGKALAFDEIEFLDASGTNLALGAVKTDPETLVEPEEPDPSLPTFRVSFDMANWGCFGYNAFDGVADLTSAGNWCTYGSTMPDGYEWLEITWPQDVTLDAVNLWVFDDKGNSRPPVSVGLQTWNGEGWADVSGLVQPESYAAGENLITFDQVTGRQFRLVFQPMEGKAIAIPEIEMLSLQEPKNVSVTGYKYISPDDKAAVIIQAENQGQTELTVEVTASSAAATTADGNALTGTAAGFDLKIAGDEGFAVTDAALMKSVTLAPGEKAEFRVVMAIGGAETEGFLTDADPLVTQKEAFNRWFLETIPYVDVPDEQIKQIYYFRWYTFRNHIRLTPDDYYIITEFLPNVGWAGKYNSINCPAGHHVAEARWLKNDEYLDDYLAHWLDYGGSVRSYSFWIANAYYERYLVNQDDYVLNYVEKLKANYDAWTSSRYNADMGLYWQYDGNDGMELAVGGHGYRPTINAYQWADAMAIAEMCRLIGDEEGAAEYTQRADTLKATMDEKLWDPEDNFYKLIRTGETERVDVREEIGYVPWMFGMPDDTEEYGSAWEALMSEDGFFSEYGPRTTELEYAARYPTGEYGTGMCRWDGPSWPFATSQTLVGMANLLNDYENQTAVDEDDYFTILKTYTKSQYKNGAPWIAENLDADNGTWIADCWRSPNYNHSQYANLIISGLFGIRPDDTDVLTINPMTPEEWDYFCLENVPYHDKLITIVYDRDGSRYGGDKGLQVYVDGEKLYQGDAVTEIQVQLPVDPVDESKDALRSLYNANRTRAEQDYAAGWEAFSQAMENAKTVLDDDSVQAEQVAAAYDALYESLRGLVRSGVNRYEAENAALTGLAKANAESNASGGRKVGTIDNTASTVTFTVTVPAAGEYDITVTADGDPAFPNPSHKVYVNGDSENYQIIRYSGTSGWGKWVTQDLTLALNEGENTITFAFNDTVEKSFSQLDCIDVFTPPVDKTRLGELYDSAGTILAGTEVLAAAEAVLYDPDVTQKQVDAAAEALEKALQDLANVIQAEALIDAIGEVTLDSKEAIDAARAAYDALTEEEKAQVGNYQTLLDAEERYANLLLEQKANQVEALIDAIGEVTLDSKEAIDVARAAYDALTDEEKALVENLQKLMDAEHRYAILVAEDYAAKAKAAAEAAEKAYQDALAALKEAEEQIAEDKTAVEEARQRAEDAKKAAEDAKSKAEAAESAAEAARKAAEDASTEAAAEAVKAAEEAAKAAEEAQKAAEYAAAAAEAAAETQKAQAAAEAAQAAAEAAQKAAEEAAREAEEAQKRAEENQEAAEKAAEEAKKAQEAAELALKKFEALNLILVYTSGLNTDNLTQHQLEVYSAAVEAAIEAVENAETVEEIEAALETLTVAMNSLLTVCPAAWFTDVDAEAWYHDSIDFVVANGYMNGVSLTTFDPNGTTTRAMLATLLYRMAGEPDVAGLENPFTDVEPDRYYTNAVIWAADQGIVTGRDKDTFDPNAAVTRQEMVTMLWRYVGYPESEADLSGYTDAGSVKDFAKAAMAWAVETGIITGVTDTTLAPEGTATRAQIATVLMRYLES